MKIPNSIKAHASKYTDGAWEQYTVDELGAFVHLLLKRAVHRVDLDKRRKDIEDAQNYLSMMQSHIDRVKALLDADANTHPPVVQ